MALSDAKSHIATLLDLSAAKPAGITTYTRGGQSKPAYLSYSELRTLVTQKADLLLRHQSIVPGKIVLIHFQNHLENITWFWTSVLAGCIPALSTPLVNNSEGRIAHFKHLHRLLLDPVVITNQKLLVSDFHENTILRIATIEHVESLASSESEATAQIQFKGSALESPQSDPIRTVNDYTDQLFSSTTNSLTENLINGRVGIATDNSTGGPFHDQTSSHRDPGIFSPKGLAVLMLTSGSTGNAKAVCLTHKQIFAAIKGKLFGIQVPPGSAYLNWIALDHVASLIEVHMCAMFLGVDQVHVPALEVLGDPLLFLRLLSEHRVSRTFAPNFFLYKLQTVLNTASAQNLQGIDLGRLLYIFSGGEPNNVGTCARLTEHLMKLNCRNKNIIVPGFGMTETCAGAIFNMNCPEIDIQADNEFATLGKCIPGIDMRISLISHTRSEMSGTNGFLTVEGALEVRGDIVFEQYFNNDQATRDAFTPDGWFKTGDLATIDPNGNLKLVGRSKELIVINGVKYLPHEIEGAIDQARIIGITQSFVVCFSHRPPGFNTEGIYVVYQHEYDTYDSEARVDTLYSIVRTVMLLTGARPNVLPLAPGRLDKTTLGKLSRAKIQTSLVQGQYKDQEALNAQILQSFRDTHFSEPRDDVEQTLMRVFISTLNIDDLEMGIDTLILDTGVSSVDLIRLKSATEQAFGIAEIPIIKILTNTTIRSLASAIRRIRSSRDEDEYNPIVTLQYNGSKTPLWLIHPGIGEVLVFLGLVQYFPDRPIHAFRARGFNPGEEPFRGLTDVVSSYYCALKQQQPHGPYAIAGYSYGSMLAFEISKILEANDDKVQFLGVFNLPPHIKDRMRMLDWTAGLLHIAHFCDIITELRSEELVDELRELPQSKQVTKLLAESDQQRCQELALTHASLLNWTNVAWSLQKIGWDYEPSGSVSHMDIFYCQPLKTVARTREEYRETKLNGWCSFVRGEIKFYEVDGEHYTMIGPNHVAKFQQTLKNALASHGL